MKQLDPVGCHDCNRPYGDPGFDDLIIPNQYWREISPTGDEGGLLCPTCICARLRNQRLTCEGAFMSGPIQSVSRPLMQVLRMCENLMEREGGALPAAPNPEE